MHQMTIHENEPTARSSTQVLDERCIERLRTNRNVFSAENGLDSSISNNLYKDNEKTEEKDFVDVNLSQLYLDDQKISEILERKGEERNEPFPEDLHVRRLNLSYNEIVSFQEKICALRNLTELDLSNNRLASLSERIGALKSLRVLSVRNNALMEMPEATRTLRNLRTLNLSGNAFDHVPNVIFDLRSLVVLSLGANQIEFLPAQVGTLTNLEVLYLGGNRLTEVPASLGRLRRLTSLVLADNQIETLPPTFADLCTLQSLTLHNNRLRALPTGIARLGNLQHLSLRNNPLVTRFVEAVRFVPPSLKELAARVLKVRTNSLAAENYYLSVLPEDLRVYLASANRCVNPRCRGVYFESCAELVKFVDFCGKYRVPLMQYLCSPRCTPDTPTCAYSDESTDEEEEMENDIILDAELPLNGIEDTNFKYQASTSSSFFSSLAREQQERRQRLHQQSRPSTSSNVSENLVNALGEEDVAVSAKMKKILLG